MADTVACFVLGLFDTGLAAVRALGRAGLTVYGFDADPHEPGFSSRYGIHAVCPSPVDEGEELVEFLCRRARGQSERPVLYTTSDHFVSFASEYRESLEPHFHLALPSRASVRAALDKAEQYFCARAAGIPTPTTHTPQTMNDVGTLASALTYPVVLKPACGHLWRERYRGEKAMAVHDGADLVRQFERVFRAGQSAIVQERVAGPNSNHYKVCAYFDRESEPVVVACMRKIRQYPVDFGVGTLMESVDEPRLRELGLRLFRAMHWRGPGSIEFKWDDADRQFKLIELNPRLWQQHGLAAACGTNFPLVQYCDATAQPPRIAGYALGVRWLDEIQDLKSAWEHRRRGALTATRWMRSLSRVRSCALWARDDPAPFFIALPRAGLGVLRRVPTSVVYSSVPGRSSH